MAYCFRIFFTLTLLATMPGILRSEEWKLKEYSKSDASPALVRVVVENSKRDKVSLTLFQFSSKDYTLKVVDQGNDQNNRKYSNLRDAMEKNGCTAGLNGGFYGADFKALGAVYSNGKKIAPYVNSSRNGLASGVIWSGVGGIHIVRRASFKVGPGVKEAIQTGPMLISNSARVKGLSKERPRPRSFVLTDWKGTWMMGTSSFVSLADLSDILASRGVFKDMIVNRAINLDGGRSTGFYLKQDNGKVTSRSEISQVRNFLGVVPR